MRNGTKRYKRTISQNRLSEVLEEITSSLSLDPNTADINDTSSDATDSDIDTTIN